jgi:hypothetical protein
MTLGVDAKLALRAPEDKLTKDFQAFLLALLQEAR